MLKDTKKGMVHERANQVYGGVCLVEIGLDSHQNSEIRLCATIDFSSLMLI